MGWLSKTWKGIKKVAKSIAKPFQKAFKQFGKFMGKIGILGQIAMMFILPGIGGAMMQSLGGLWTGAAGSLGTFAGANAGTLLGTLAKGTAAVMNGVTTAVTTVGNVFSNITKGVTNTLGEFAKTATNKLANTFGFDPVFENAASNFFSAGGTTGADTAFGRSFGAESHFQNVLSDPKLATKHLEALQETAVESRAFESSVADLATNVGEDIVGSTVSPLDTGSPITESFKDITLPENLKSGYDEKGFLLNPSSVEESMFGFNPNTEYSKAGVGTEASLLSDPKKYISDKLSSAYDEVTGFVKDPIGGVADMVGNPGEKFVDSTIGSIASGVGQQITGTIPEDNSTAFYGSVPTFQTAQVGQYGASQIQTPAMFQQQVLNNPSPYGFTAFDFASYANKFGAGYGTV